MFKRQRTILAPTSTNFAARDEMMLTYVRLHRSRGKRAPPSHTAIGLTPPRLPLRRAGQKNESVFSAQFLSLLRGTSPSPKKKKPKHPSSGEKNPCARICRREDNFPLSSGNLSRVSLCKTRSCSTIKIAHLCLSSFHDKTPEQTKCVDFRRSRNGLAIAHLRTFPRCNLALSAHAFSSNIALRAR